MEKEKTQKQINSLFKRRLASYQRQYKREIESFANIPFGYGMRAYHRLKTASDKSSETRNTLENMVRCHKIDTELLREAIYYNVLSAYFINEYQKTNF